MNTAIEQALSTLRTRGTVTLTGAPATWSSVLQVMFIVLLVMVGLIAVAAVAGLPFAIASGVEVTAFTYFGLVCVLGVLTVMALLLRRGYRAQQRYREQERENLTLDARGITLRGVGPVPWADFGPAEHRMVPAERDSGRVRRAVMELTYSGMVAVNQHLHPDLRKRLSPAIGPLWNRHHRYIYVPAVEGMSQKDVMFLINSAREIFRGGWG